MMPIVNTIIEIGSAENFIIALAVTDSASCRRSPAYPGGYLRQSPAPHFYHGPSDAVPFPGHPVG